MVNLYKKNKKFASIFIAAVLFVATSSVVFAAGSAHLTWTANSDSDLAGYNVYYAIDSLFGSSFFH